MSKEEWITLIVGLIIIAVCCVFYHPVAIIEEIEVVPEGPILVEVAAVEDLLMHQNGLNYLGFSASGDYNIYTITLNDAAAALKQKETREWLENLGKIISTMETNTMLELVDDTDYERVIYSIVNGDEVYWFK